ncbi:MAG: TonB-dependent receptor [Bacteroidetes bacterium]|nr:TonB-dependent receptor [Bacteroidota bacterium]
MKKWMMTAIAGGAVATCFAQSEKNMADTVLSKYLDEVIVSATRFPQVQSKIAQQTSVLTAKYMQTMNQQTTAEMLMQSGQVLVQKSQLGGGSPILRGFEANKVLLVIDGVRMNNAIYRGGHLQNVLTIDNSILERTEILFGPASVVYGSDALGGVMSFTTKTPSFTTGKKTLVQANAFFRYASAYAETSGHADVSIGGKKLASLTSFTYSDFGNLRQGAGYYSSFPDWGKRNFSVQRINNKDSMVANPNEQKQLGSAYHQFDLLQKLVFKTGNVTQQLNVQVSQTGNVGRYDRLTETNGAGIAKSAEWYYGPAKRIMVAYMANFAATKMYDKASVTAAWQGIEESRHNRNFGSVKRNHRTENVDVLSVNADFLKAYKKGELRYGAEIIYNKVRSVASFENIETGETGKTDTRYPDGGSNTQSYALFANNTHSLTKKLLLNSGIRATSNRLYAAFTDKTFFPFPYNDIEQQFITATGNLGLVFLPAKGWKLSVLASSGYRTPNVDDMAKVFESGNGMLIVPNPDIKPERTWNYEAGVSTYKKGVYKMAVNVWYCDYRNVLATDSGTFNGQTNVDYDGNQSRVVTVVNKSRGFQWGTGLDAGVSFAKHFTLSGVINYTYGRFVEDGKKTPMDHIAPVYGKLSAAAAFTPVEVELFMLFNGKKRSADYRLGAEDNELYSADPVNGYTPAWSTLNIRTSVNINRHLAALLAVENITDKYYRVFASGLSAPGRNVVITLRGRF